MKSAKSLLRRTRKRISRLVLLFATLRHIACGSLRALPLRRALRLYRIGLSSLVLAYSAAALLPRNQVRSLRLRRLLACGRCPLFDTRRKTCGRVGSLFTDVDGESRPLGCWCFLPAATALPKKECWLSVNDFGPGWKPEPFAFWRRWRFRRLPVLPGTDPIPRRAKSPPPE